jgi:3'-5' exoribonuclease
MTQIVKTQFVGEIRVKDKVSSVFLVKYISVGESRDGRPYLNLVASDKSGDVECRMWQNAREAGQEIVRGDFVQIEGKMNQFQGKRQLVIDSIQKVDADLVTREDFVSKSVKNPDAMFARLQEIVNGLDDVYIKELLNHVFSDTEVVRRLKLWPAAKSIHHNYESGLLEHILSCTELASMLAPFYRVNRNYVIAGAVLHDIGKIYEMSDGPFIDYTEEGRLVGHVVKASELIERFSHKIRGFPYQTKLHLKHIVLSHHGEYDFGSPKLPQTAEAYLFHLIDLLDSKMGSIEAIKRVDAQNGHWSSYIEHLDRMIYKKDLPGHTEFLSLDEDAAVGVEAPKKRASEKKSGELKQNLGDLLKSAMEKKE